MLRSEPPHPPPTLHPPPSSSCCLTICFSDVTRACLCACMFAPLDLYLCVSAEQTMREAITMGTAGLSYCGWLIISSPLACFHVSEYVRASLCKIRGEKTREGMQERWRRGIFEQHSFKKLIFFYGIPTKREIRGQFYFCPVALFFLPFMSTNRDLQTANLCLSDSESPEDHLGCM